MIYYSFLTESIRYTSPILIQKIFKDVIDKYKSKYGFNLSYMKLVISEVPVFNNGKPNKDMKPEESGGSWTKLKKIYINPDVDSVMKHYKVTCSKTDYITIIIAHELAHEIWNNVCNEYFKKIILVKARKEDFHTVYLDSLDKSYKKYKEEVFCEYLANSILNDKNIILKIDFPKEEIPTLKNQDRIITTRVSDDYDKYHVGDIVRTPWNTVYKIVDRKDFANIKDHPYYKELTIKQRSKISRYDGYCVLTLEKI